MKHYRVTSTGRRIAAQARVRSEPDTEQLIALVLHIAERLHAQELDEQRRISAKRDTEDSPPTESGSGEQGENHDLDAANANSPDRSHLHGGDVPRVSTQEQATRGAGTRDSRSPLNAKANPARATADLGARIVASSTIRDTPPTTISNPISTGSLSTSKTHRVDYHRPKVDRLARDRLVDLQILTPSSKRVSRWFLNREH